MKELSEKELEDQYRNLKMTDVPDLWESIERNLAPKKPQKAKKTVPNRLVVPLAAAVAVAVLLVPVTGVLRQSGAGENMAYENFTGGSSDAADVSDSVTMPAEEQTESPENDAQASRPEDGENQSQMELTVLVEQVRETDGGLALQAQVVEAGDSGYQPGNQLCIVCENGENSYQKEDFQGTLCLRVEKHPAGIPGCHAAGTGKGEEALRLLEILP